LAAVVGSAQGGVSPSVADMYVISAKAGVVSFVEGGASVARKNGKSGALLKDDKLDAGDRVSTGANGRVEVLLNPGSYLRLNANSSFEFESTSLDDLRIKLLSGSAIFEVIAADDFRVSLTLPKAGLVLTRSGVFRVDVFGDGTGRVSVWRGRLALPGGGDEIKAGRSALISGRAATVARFDRDNADDFDVWSRLRGKELAKATDRLERNTMRRSLMSSYNRGLWNVFNTFGLWVFDPVRRMWLFLPFADGWNSPYGFDYGYGLWYYRLPWWVYQNPYPTGGSGGGTGTGGGGGGGGQTTPTVPNATREERQERSVTPPFMRTNQNGQRVENPSGGSTTSGGGSPNWTPNRRERNETFDSPRMDTKPVYTPPPPPPVSQPTTKNQKDNN
jgi:hypothetical protein